jgi:hypothetical protein
MTFYAPSRKKSFTGRERQKKGGPSKAQSAHCTGANDPLQSFGDVAPSGRCLILAPPILLFPVGVEKAAECPILPAPINVGQVVEIRFLLQLQEVPQVFFAQLVSLDCGTYLATGLAGMTTVGIPAALCERFDIGKGLTDAFLGAEHSELAHAGHVDQ